MSNIKATDHYKKTDVQHLVHTLLQLGGSLMFWRMPGSDEKILLVCNSGASVRDEISLQETTPGFVLAPFNPSQSKYFFRADLVFRFKGDQLIDGPDLPNTTVSKKQITDGAGSKESSFYTSEKEKKVTQPSFLDIVKSCIEKTRTQSVEKIVPTTCREIELSGKFDAVKLFSLLCDKHPQAFVSLVTSPETGTWVGATPELLVSVDSTNKFRTIALAGTQKLNPDIDPKSVAWTQKEIEEQALVSRYIINCFKKIRVREYAEHGPYTVTAGSLLHLRTDYEIDMKEINFPELGSVMLKLLHPTSAVCGMPFEPAFDFLQKNEGYDREFYSGYLGPVNFNGESKLFVNLRCLQLLENKVRIYAGAGVTADSIAEKEVDEVEMKIKTLSQLIQS